MNKIELVELKLKAFRSFKGQEQTGILPDSGIIGIMGFDVTHNTTSGAGKSNLHLAISYALGYCPFPLTALQNWSTKDPLQVELTLKSSEGLAVIRRGEELSFSLNGEVTKGSAKAVEAAIRKFVGIPIELLDPLTFRQQDSQGRFLSMTDGEKKDFLSILLGLDELEIQIEESKKKALLAEKEIDLLKIQINTKFVSLKDVLQPELESTTEHDLKIKSIFEYYKLSVIQMNDLTAKIKQLEGEIVMINGSLASETEDDLLNKYELERYNTLISKAKSDILEKQTDLKDQIKFAEKVYNSCLLEAAKLSGINESYKALNKLIDGIKSGVCPTCSNNWITEEEKLKELESNKISLEVQIKGCLKAKEMSEATSLEIKELYKQLEDIDHSLVTELVRKREAVETNRIQKSLDFNHSQMEKKKPLLKELNKLQTSFHAEMAKQEQFRLDGLTASSEIKRIKELNSFKINKYDTDVVTNLKVNNEIGALNTELKVIEDRFNQESDLASMLKSFLGTIFEEVLAEVEIESNDMLRHIPNVSSTTIRFATESSTQKGKIKQEIKPLISKNGVEIPLRAGLSGGQLSSIYLAVDLAVGTVIGRRTNVCPGWLVVDEPFSGMSLSEKESCVELLKVAAKDKMVLVIEHASEIKEHFNKIIEVESINDVSTIKAVN